MTAPVQTEASGRDLAYDIAAFADKLTFEDLAPNVVQAAKTNIIDTLACMIAGSSADGVQDLADLISQWGGAPQATVVGLGLRAPAHHAALINAMMGHARDFDDTHDQASLHAGVTVIPAALAAAEMRGDVPGRELITAIVAGLEVVCRLGLAIQTSVTDSGFVFTSLVGGFGAAVAAGKVLSLTEAQLVNAIGIAYSQAAGTYQTVRDGAMTKRLQPGFASMAGTISAQLGRTSITGTKNTFEGQDGLFRSYFADQYDASAIRADLGTRFECLGLSYKLYPCCRFSHSGIDVAHDLMQQHELSPNDIERIEVGVNPTSFSAVCEPAEIKTAPKTTIEAQFSLPFCIAAVICDRAVTLDHFTQAAIDRPDLRALSTRVVCLIDPKIEKETPRGVAPTQMRIITRNGREYTRRSGFPMGDPRNPVSQAAIVAKLKQCGRFSARSVPDGFEHVLLERVGALEQMDEISGLINDLNTENKNNNNN